MRKFKKKFGFILSLGIITLFVIFIVRDKEALEGLISVPVWVPLAVGIGKVLKIANSAQYTMVSLQAYGKYIRFGESFYISLLTTIGNYLGPVMGGAGIRAVYLKKKYKFAYTDFVSILSGFYLMSFLIYALLGLASLAFLHAYKGVYMAPLYVFFIFWLVLNLTLALMPKRIWLRLIPNRGRILRNLRATISRVLDGWIEVKKDHRLIRRLMWIIVEALLLAMITSAVEFWALDIQLSIPVLLLYTVISSLSLLVSFTPGAIGIRESLYIFTASVLFLTNDQILQLAVLDRGVNYIVLFLLFLWSRKFKPSVKQEALGEQTS